MARWVGDEDTLCCEHAFHYTYAHSLPYICVGDGLVMSDVIKFGSKAGLLYLVCISDVGHHIPKDKAQEHQYMTALSHKYEV